MAKEDFCFTYYDGDAARDKAHMNRLERGAYDDLISAQRKRGHLSLEDIKKVLSGDFDKCWNSIEWILIKDIENKYYIEWVDKSIEKMRRQSENQKKNASKRWEKDNATALPRHINGIAGEMPLEDGNGNEDEEENINKEVDGFFFNEMSPEMELTRLEINAIKGFIDAGLQRMITDDDVKRNWEAFKIDNFKKHEWKKSHEDLLSHFRRTLKIEIKTQKNGTTQSTYTKGGGLSGNAVIRSDKTFEGTL